MIDLIGRSRRQTMARSNSLFPLTSSNASEWQEKISTTYSARIAMLYKKGTISYQDKIRLEEELKSIKINFLRLNGNPFLRTEVPKQIESLQYKLNTLERNTKAQVLIENNSIRKHYY